MSDLSNASALILNGGRSQRMGGADKSRIVVEGQSIAERQLEFLAQRFDSVAMVGDSITLPDAAEVEGLRDRVGGKGPVDGIAAGLAWTHCDWLFVLGSDMPYPSLPLLDALLDARRDESDIVCVLVAERAQPLFALYHRRLLPRLDARLAQGLLRAGALLREPLEGVVVETISEASARRLDPKLLSFRNLNSPEDVLTSGASIE